MLQMGQALFLGKFSIQVDDVIINFLRSEAT